MANTVEIIIKGTDNATGAISSVKSGLGGLSSSLQSAGKSMMDVGGKMTLGITGPLALIGKQALTTAGDFQAGMNMLAIAARSSGTAMEDLSKAAILVGKDTQLVGIDAMQAAGAMTNFYKAGLTTSDVFADLQGYLAGTTELTGALRSAIDLAAASDLELEGASLAVAEAMATFGLSAEDAAAIANSFVGAADASTAEVSDLAEALRNVGPTMAQFGYSLQDTNIALAILSTRGIKGAEAGTALKSMMTNLMRPTDQVKLALSELNVALYNADGSMRSMPEIIGDLSSAMAGMTDEQKNQYIQTLAGTYGMKAMATLLEEGALGWDEMAAAIGNAASAQEVGAARTQGFNAAMEQLQGAIQTFMITSITPLLPMLAGLVNQIGAIVGAMIEADPQLIQMGLVVAAIAAAAGPLLLALGGIVTVLGALISPIGLVVTAITALGLAWATNFLGIRDITTEAWMAIQAAIQTVVEFIAPYVQEFIATIHGWFVENWPAIQAVVEEVWAAIQAVTQAVVGAVVPFIKDQFDYIITWFKANWPLIKQTVETVLNAVLSVVQSVIGWIRNFWESNHEAILTVARSVWNIIKSTIETIINTILGIIRTVMLVINGDWEGAWTEIQNIALGIWEDLKLKFDEAMNAVKAILSLILPVLQELWDTAWTAIKDKAVEIWTAIKDFVSTAMTNINQTVTRVLSNTFTWITSKVADWIQVGKDLVGGMAQGITDTVQRVIDAGKGIMNALAQGILSIALPVPTVSLGWGNWNGIPYPTVDFGVTWKTIGSMFGNAANAASRSAGAEIGNAMQAAVRTGVEGIGLSRVGVEGIGVSRGSGKKGDGGNPAYGGISFGEGGVVGGVLLEPGKAVFRIGGEMIGLPARGPASGGSNYGGGGGSGGGGLSGSRIEEILIEIRDTVAFIAGKDPDSEFASADLQYKIAGLTA